MKRFALVMVLCAGALVSATARADVAASALIGTWKSPQAVDTDLVITQTASGLMMAEVHQNFHGGATVDKEPITVVGDRLNIGTWSLHFDEATKSLVTLIRPPSTYISFLRVQQPAGAHQ